MIKDFDTWNSIKKDIDNSEKNIPFFHIKEIWWFSCGLNVGSEYNGKNNNFERPFLIIKRFSKDIIWGLPLTTSKKDNKYFYMLHVNNLNSNVILSQIKTLSTKRLLRKICMISGDDFKNIVNKIKTLLS